MRKSSNGDEVWLIPSQYKDLPTLSPMIATSRFPQGGLLSGLHQKFTMCLMMSFVGSLYLWFLSKLDADILFKRQGRSVVIYFCSLLICLLTKHIVQKINYSFLFSSVLLMSRPENLMYLSSNFLFMFFSYVQALEWQSIFWFFA